MLGCHSPRSAMPVARPSVRGGRTTEISGVELIFFATVVAATVLLFDLSVPLGVAGGVPYVALVLLGLWAPERHHVFILALAGSALTVVGYVYSTPLGHPWVVLTNRGLALFAIWVTAILIAKHQAAMEALCRARRDLEQRVEKRTASLRRANAALRASQARARAAEARLIDAIESISEGFALYDAEDRLVICNSRFREICGDATGLAVWGVTFEEQAWNSVRQGLVAAAAGREEEWVKERVERHRNPRGSFEQELSDGRWLLINERRTRDGGCVGVRTDITEIKRREAALQAAEAAARESEQRLHTVMDNVGQGVITFTEAGTIESLNSAAERIFGYSADEIVGHSVSILVPEPFRMRYHHRLANYLGADKVEQFGTGPRELSGQRKDGTVFPIEVTLCEVLADGRRLVVSIVRDITDRKSEWMELVQGSKIASLGEIAASIIHELSQPLSIITMAADSALALADEGKADIRRQRTQFEVISGQTRRMAEIITHMRGFLRRDKAEMEPFDPVGSIRDSVTLVDKSFRDANIHIHSRYPIACARVRGHPVQLEQVILNLLTNARDAIVERRRELCREAADFEGRIEVYLSQTLHEVTILVADNGGGLREDVADDVFQPFVTTKEAGQGTGLGLPICRGIIAAMGGMIEVKKGRDGAEFRITLPAEPAEDDDWDDATWPSSAAAG